MTPAIFLAHATSLQPRSLGPMELGLPRFSSPSPKKVKFEFQIIFLVHVPCNIYSEYLF